VNAKIDSNGGLTAYNCCIASQSNPTRVAGTIYHNTSGKPLFVTVTVSGGGSGAICRFYTDSSSSPTTDVVEVVTPIGGGEVPVTFIVLPGNYYRSDFSGGFSIVVWTEMAMKTLYVILLIALFGAVGLLIGPGIGVMLRP